METVSDVPKIGLLDIDIIKGAGSISGIKYIGRESIISLYKGHQPVDGRKLFQDLSALVTLGNIPADVISVSANHFQLSTQSGVRIYEPTQRKVYASRDYVDR